MASITPNNSSVQGTPYDFATQNNGSYTQIKADVKNGIYKITGGKVIFTIKEDSQILYETTDIQTTPTAGYTISSAPRLATDSATSDIRYAAAASLTLGDGSTAKPAIVFSKNIYDKFVLEYDAGEVITELGESPILEFGPEEIKSTAVVPATTPATYKVTLEIPVLDFNVPFSGETFINVTMPQA